MDCGSVGLGTILGGCWSMWRSRSPTAGTISDVQGLADQPALHGRVASKATIWRALAAVDAETLAGLRAARAVARERAWAACGELTGVELPPARAAGRDLPYAVIDIDATLVTAHSDKEGFTQPH